MQSGSRIFDDLSKLMTNAAGVAQGAREEAETAFQSWFDRFLADRNIVTREEFDAVREMASKARDENETLSRQVAKLEAAIAELHGGATASGAGAGASGGAAFSAAAAAGGATAGGAAASGAGSSGGASSGEDAAGSAAPKSQTGADAGRTSSGASDNQFPRESNSSQRSED